MTSQRSKDQIKQENRSPIQESYRAGDESPLLALLQSKSGRSRTATKQLLSARRVSVNGIPASPVDTQVKPGDLITVHHGGMKAPFSHPLFKILWEDDHYIFIDKSTGIYTINTTHKDKENTIIWLLSKYYKEINPACKLFMINRLDKETAGIVVMAKSIEAKDLMIERWHRIVRDQVFVAVVEGELNESTQELTTRSGDNKDNSKHKKVEKLSHCSIKTLKSSTFNTLHVIEARLGGERIFSLRKILGDNGLVILGDGRYHSSYMMKGKIALEQTLLELTHPLTMKPLRFERPFPTHLFNHLKMEKNPIDELEKKPQRRAGLTPKRGGTRSIYSKKK